MNNHQATLAMLVKQGLVAGIDIARIKESCYKDVSHEAETVYTSSDHIKREYEEKTDARVLSL